VIESFPPVVGSNPAVLILGSMPGVRSLAEEQYYAHPRNRFWPVLHELIQVDPEASYRERVECMTASGVALWDVLKHCRREGSLDSSIVKTSEDANDVAGFLDRHPSIRAVALNGRKAAEVFRRRISVLASAERGKGPVVLDLPSTSPANARLKLPALVREWEAIKPFLPDHRFLDRSPESKPGSEGVTRRTGIAPEL